MNRRGAVLAPSDHPFGPMSGKLFGQLFGHASASTSDEESEPEQMAKRSAVLAEEKAD